MRSRSYRASNEVSRSTCFAWMDLNHIRNSPGKKNDWHMMCREQREISLTVLLVNCHDVTGRIFRQVNFAPNRYEKSFKMAWPTRKKIKDFRKSIPGDCNIKNLLWGLNKANPLKKYLRLENLTKCHFNRPGRRRRRSVKGILALFCYILTFGLF